MRIELDEKEIEVAICQYINGLGFSLPEDGLEITMKAGRGPNGGHTATIGIGEMPESAMSYGSEDPVQAVDKALGEQSLFGDGQAN